MRRRSRKLAGPTAPVATTAHNVALGTGAEGGQRRTDAKEQHTGANQRDGVAARNMERVLENYGAILGTTNLSMHAFVD